MSKKRLLAWIMTLCMIATLLPMTAFADGSDWEPDDAYSEDFEYDEPSSDDAGDYTPAYTGELKLEDGTYQLPELAASLGMFNHFVLGSTKLVVSGDKATLSFITDGSTKSIQKYTKIALGKSSELLTEVEVKGYQETLPEGTVIIEGKLQDKEAEGDPDQYLFEIEMTNSEAEALLSNDKNEDIYVTLFNKEGSSTEKKPGWYKAENDCFLSLGVEFSVPLEISNTTNMFKAVSASLNRDELGYYLVFALSGTGYRHLYKGTYEQAVKNGDNEDKWIHGYENAANKWEFVVPLEDGETFIPIVSISQSYLEKYKEGKNPLERAFYPRYVLLEGLTLITGDYEESHEVSVVNNVKMFKPAETALIHNVGGPNSNNYKGELILPMGSDAFDEVFVGSAPQASLAGKGIPFAEDKTFTIPFRWIEEAGKPETIHDLSESTFVLSFHSVKNQTWYERLITIDDANNVVTFDPVPEAEVGFTSQYKGKYLHAPQIKTKVSGALAETFGYEDYVDEKEAVSALDVLVLAHILTYGEAFTPETAEDYLTVSFGSPTKQFEIAPDPDTYLYYGGFMLNYAYPNDGTKYDKDYYNGTTVGTQKVADGDFVEFFFYEDPSFSDTCNWFADKEGNFSGVYETFAGTDLELKLKGLSAMEIGRYKDETELVASDLATPIANAQIYTVNVETGALTAIDGAVTDKDGYVKLNFKETGTYYIVAYGTEDCATTLILSASMISVNEPYGFTMYADGKEIKDIEFSATYNTCYFPAPTYEPAHEVIPMAVVRIPCGAEKVSVKFDDTESKYSVYYYEREEGSAGKLVPVPNPGFPGFIDGFLGYIDNGFYYADANTLYEVKKDLAKDGIVLQVQSAYNQETWESSNLYAIAFENMEHDYQEVVTKATPSKDGKIEIKCSVCGHVKESVVIPKAGRIILTWSSHKYTGKVQKPDVIVKATTDEKEEVISKDNYTVTYENKKSKDTGSYGVTVKFKESSDFYTGTKKLTYKITPAPNKITKVTPKKKTYKASDLKKSKKSFTISATVNDGAKLSYSLTSVPKAAKNYIKVNSKGKVTIGKGLKAGTYKIKVKISAKATKNYKSATTTATITIVVK